MEKTIEIPEGYEARIEDNKVIFERKSEDERIREAIESIIRVYGKTQGEWIAGYDMDTLVVHLRDAFAYLERQKEQKPFPAGDEKDFLEKEVKAFLCNYDKEFDDDAPTYDIAEHFYQLGKNLQKPAEWSKKDKIHLNNAILVAKKEWGVNSYTARWLESLRDNYKKCNSHWKPSEEQMDRLFSIVVALRKDYCDDMADFLASLYKQLEKL